MLTSVTEIEDIFEPILEISPADETEFVWLERRHGRAHTDESKRAFLEPWRITVLVRVVERGRVGWHRSEAGSRGDLEVALRQAMALATLEPKARRLPVFPTTLAKSPQEIPLFDPRIAALVPKTAFEQINKLIRNDESAALHWSQHHLVVANSHGVRRHAEATEVSLEFRSGSGLGAGYAAASARSLAGLEADGVAERARVLRIDGAGGQLEFATALPAVLAPEAVIELINILNIFALAGRAFLEGSSVLARHRHTQVFDRAFELRDDPALLPGLPFPFDFEGSIKRPLDLVVGGRPELTALSQFQGGEVGMESTAASVGGQDALFGNLFLKKGELGRQDLLARADGGIFIGWLDRPECFVPEQLHIRARARGVRRIRNGKLAEALPDFLWECSLLQALARLRGVGAESVVRAMPSTPLGAIAAPALVLEELIARALESNKVESGKPDVAPEPEAPAQTPEPDDGVTESEETGTDLALEAENDVGGELETDPDHETFDLEDWPDQDSFDDEAD